MPRNGKLFENLYKWLPQGADVDGMYDVPVIAPVYDMPFIDGWMPFNDLSRCGDKNHGLNMYVDDYRIERLWHNPDRYLMILQKYGLVLSPDFSIYTDVPIVLSIYNHYRKHWLGAYWQQNKITVIPTICWGDDKTFEWCFDGEPEKSVVSVSSVGTQRYADTKVAFMRGYDAMMERLQPETVLFFGKVPEECRGNICPVEAFYKQVERRRKK